MRVHSRELHRGVSLMISKQKMKCEKKASTQFDAACNQIKYFIELRCEKQGELYSNVWWPSSENFHMQMSMWLIMRKNV